MTDSKETLTVSCHCKAIRITIPPPRKALNECQCTICRRYGALWAYYLQDEVTIEGTSTETYIWGDRDINFNRCKTCGCVVSWTPTEAYLKKRPEKRIGVNCRMLDLADLEKLDVRKSKGPD